MTDETKWEVPDMVLGEVAVDFKQDGVRVRIMRGPKSLCAYFGVPTSHPLAFFSFNRIPLDVHGGLSISFDGAERDAFFPKRWFWYGWDYNHGGDATIPSVPPNIARTGLGDEALPDGKRWTVAEVEEQAREALPDFQKLVRLAGLIASKAQRSMS